MREGDFAAPRWLRRTLYIRRYSRAPPSNQFQFAKTKLFYDDELRERRER
jgi:hypothetical protein